MFFLGSTPPSLYDIKHVSDGCKEAIRTSRSIADDTFSLTKLDDQLTISCRLRILISLVLPKSRTMTCSLGCVSSRLSCSIFLVRLHMPAIRTSIHPRGTSCSDIEKHALFGKCCQPRIIFLAAHSHKLYLWTIPNHTCALCPDRQHFKLIQHMNNSGLASQSP